MKKCTDTKACETCGVHFPVGGRAPRKPRTARFCSHKCAGAARGTGGQCEKCAKPVKGNRRFCSRGCWEASRDHTHNKTEYTCARCSTKFMRWPSQRQKRATSGKVYCSGTCRAAGRVYAVGPAHPQWKDESRVVRGDGYVHAMVKEHPKATKDGYVLEHRHVMEKKLGRYLTATETVHHIDGDRANNAPENLQLRQGKHGKGVVHRCADCGSHNIVSSPI